MNVPQKFPLLVVLGFLSACYGTKAPAPQRAAGAPPGLVKTVAIAPAAIIPEALPQLLGSYRQSLIAAAHHLPPDAAEKYADAEIRSLKTTYAHRETELKSELVRRLQSPKASSLPRQPQSRPTRSPGDPRDPAPK